MQKTAEFSAVAVHGVMGRLFWAVYTGTRPGVTPAIRAGKGWRGRRELALRCSATQLGACVVAYRQRHVMNIWSVPPPPPPHPPTHTPPPLPSSRPCCGAEADPCGLMGVMRRFMSMVWRWVFFAAFWQFFFFCQQLLVVEGSLAVLRFSLRRYG